MLHPPKLIPYFAALLACTCAFAQANRNIVLSGCLSGGPRAYVLAATDTGQVYALTGNTAALAQYVEREISVAGNLNRPTQLSPSFHVLGLKRVFDRPQPTLNASFGDSSHWQQESSPEYGIEFAHPPRWTSVPDLESSMLQPNFAANQSVIVIGSFPIPIDLYPGSNFVGGTFGLFVNPAITNPQSCSEFGDGDPRLRSARLAHTIQYTVFKSRGGAMGTNYLHQYLHTFQNGLCYEIGFELAEVNTANYDAGCTIPAISESDESKIIDPLLAAISFRRPTIASAIPQNTASAVPRVTKFNASSNTADDTANRGQITFSWSTENVDYIQLSYRCTPAPSGAGIAIVEDGLPRECDNGKLHLYEQMIPNRSPNASQTVGFGNFFQPQPISVTVTLTPFSHATAYPAASKSITVQVDADNAFPDGVPAANRRHR